VKNQRKIFLINPNFQLKFSILICLVITLIASIYPLSFYGYISNLVTKISGANASLAEEIDSTLTSVIFILVMFQLAFTTIIFVISIFFTHKVAGPIYKLRKFMAMLRDGQNVPKLKFRNGDYFQDLAEDFNETVQAVQDGYKNDVVYLSEISSYLNNLSLVVPDDKKAVISEINKKLSEMQEKFTESP
jgi:sensor histidine kinase YesM